MKSTQQKQTKPRATQRTAYQTTQHARPTPHNHSVPRIVPTRITLPMSDNVIRPTTAPSSVPSTSPFEPLVTSETDETCYEQRSPTPN